MRPIFLPLTLLLASSPCLAQQGDLQRLYRGDSLEGLRSTLATYLNAEPVQSILTPGEFVEWKLKLKADQVVIAEASSGSFDPALEIVDSSGKTLAANDDRFPGDQRPLLLWRCEKDGDYALHVRCFHDKSGGPVTTRFQSYESLNLGSAQKAEKEFDTHTNFLLRIPMKAGEVKEVLSGATTNDKYMPVRGVQFISPSGLPDIHLCSALAPISQNTTLVAPVSGDYYLVVSPYGRGDGRAAVQAWTRELVPQKLAKTSSGYAVDSPTNSAVIGELPVKAGDLIEASALNLDIDSQFVLTEKPDFSKWDMSKPETNPFLPTARNSEPDRGPAVDVLPARARDNREMVFRARRDTTLWLATDARSQAKTFAMLAKRAANDLAAEKSSAGKLRIADTDYWSFEANAGDVMTLDSTAHTFNQVVVVRDPDLNEIRRSEPNPDQASNEWRMIVQKPGRYLVAVSSFGDGGGGDYSLSRKVFHAKEFSVGTPAKGDIGEGEVQIWKFTATPSKPMLVHWSSSSWNYDVAIYDEKGNPTGFQRDEIDGYNRLGILKVARPQTFVVVLTGNKGRSNYSIDLNELSQFERAK
ncbi:MAG TPA: hypothetical protein VG944_12320 [Fimbriimonas sp.]|nr:hypothetical protein [Fimbriimonas sp.]